MMVTPYWSDDAVTIWHGNALDLPLEDESVDLVVTSPPYWSLRSYRDGGEHYEGQVGSEETPEAFIDALAAATREMARVLKPSGSIFVNLGDKYGPEKSLMLLPEQYRIRAVKELGLIARAVVIWEKTDALPESAQDRAHRSHEDWVHLTKSSRYFAEMDGLREPHMASTLHRGGGRNGPGYVAGAPRSDRHLDATNGQSSFAGGINPLGRLPRSVWSVPTESLRIPADLDVRHFAVFPLEWPRRLIRGWCPPGGTVLDPFGGSGTTALVARALGRRAHHVDLSRDYCRLARWRVTDRGELARAMQVEKPPETPDGMDSLLDMLGETA